MPFRTKLRRALTGAEGHGPLSKIKARGNTTPPEDDDYYKPGEKMPPLKYRRPVDPAHMKRLEAFSFRAPRRRQSHESSLYSPNTSRVPSRRASIVSHQSRSHSKARSRRSSFSNASDYDAEDWVDSGIGASIAGDERPVNIKEASDDEGDVLNVGLSRNPTEDPRDPKWKSSNGRYASVSTNIPSRSITASDHTRLPSQPFCPQDLEIALQKSHLEATAPDSDDSSGDGPPSTCFEDPDACLRPRGGSFYVPYDGQGTPPKLPYWGAADENNPELAYLNSRRASVFYVHDESFTPQYERTQSFLMSSERRQSVFHVDDDDFADPPRSTAIFVPNDFIERSSTASSSAGNSHHSETPPKPQRKAPKAPNHQSQSSCPNETRKITTSASPTATSAPIDCPPKPQREPPQPPKRKPPPSCPSDAIAAILARTDL